MSREGSGAVVERPHWGGGTLVAIPSLDIHPQTQTALLMCARQVRSRSSTNDNYNQISTAGSQWTWNHATPLLVLADSGGRLLAGHPRSRPETSFTWWTIRGLVREDSEKSKMGHRDTCSHFSSYRDRAAAVEIQPTATSRVPSREPTRTRRRLASTKNSDGASRTAVTAHSPPRTPFRTTKGSHRHHAGGRFSTRTRAPDVSETGTTRSGPSTRIPGRMPVT